MNNFPKLSCELIVILLGMRTMGPQKIMKTEKNNMLRAITGCVIVCFTMIATQETAQAQQVTARTLDNWLQKHASPAQRARCQDYHNKVRDYFLKQNWSPNRKYNRAQAEYAAYKLIRSPQYSASYLRLICGSGTNNSGQEAKRDPIFTFAEINITVISITVKRLDIR